jgi:hypothetical protein
MNTKYGSRGNSGKSSKQSSNQDSSNSSTGLNGGGIGSLKRSASKIKARIAIEKGGVNDESSFKEAHEYGLEALSPVAQGYGDDLVSPMEEVHAVHMMDDKTIDRRFRARIENAPGPGSFIISPSPSVSSDDEASLVQKKHTHDGLPYGLPSRDEDRTWGPSLRQELQNRSQEPPQSHSGEDQEIRYGLAVSSSVPEHLPLQYTGSGLGSPVDPNSIERPPRIRRKLSKERWRQVYEQDSRIPPATPPK